MLTRRLVLVSLAAAVSSACGASPPSATARPAEVDAADAAALDSKAPRTADVSVVAAPDAPAKPVLPGKVAAPVIASVEPASGSTAGMVTVRVVGTHLGKVDQIAFGDSPGLALQVLSDTEALVTVPPHPPGMVDVDARVPAQPDAIVGTLAFGYRYVAPVEIHSVTPPTGPATGGTLATVKGKGFVAGAAFAVGDRLAIGATVLDESTATLITPPGVAGKARVAVQAPDGGAVLQDGFAYRAVPHVAWVTPALGPLAGGTAVVLHGEGLVASGSALRLVRPDAELTAQITGATPDARTLFGIVPPGTAAGAWDVRIATAEGGFTVAGAWTYIDTAYPPGDIPAVVGVAPAQLPVNKLQPVAIALTGVVAGLLGDVTVFFGGKLSKIIEKSASGDFGATLLVQPPLPAIGAPLPLSIDVIVQVGSHVVAKPEAFQYLPVAPSIVLAEPVVLPAAGGAPFQVKWVGAPSAWGSVVAVRVGALACGKLLASAVHAVCTSPVGAPGRATVALEFAGKQRLEAPDAVEFVGVRGLAMIIAARGAQAGGTLVDVLGGDLRDLKEVWLGATKGSALHVVDAGLAHVRTPRGSPGTVDAVAVFSGGEQIGRERAYTYFDPVAGDYGTWGAPIGGALNVTVTRKGKGGPVPGATVVADAPGHAALYGMTDDRGQITLSVAGLRGPLHVHATAPGFQAGSVVALAVENVTIRLAGLPKPGNPALQPDVPLPDGMVTGTVVGADKYAVLPIGSCVGLLATSGNCKPCKADDDCFYGTTCEIVTPPKGSLPLANVMDPDLPDAPTDVVTKHCAKPCAVDADCPATFECRGIGTTLESAKYRCVPRIGVRETRCETSGPSIFGGQAAPGPGGIVDTKGRFAIHSHPGDVAVVCRAGYVEPKGEFVPLAMGLKRGLFVGIQQKVTGVVVAIQTPLDRALRVRMDRIPMGSDATGIRSLTAGLDLGGEGYVRVADVQTNARTDTLSLPRQPHDSLFSGDNSDIRYELYGGLSNKYGGPPSSTALAIRVAAHGFDHPAQWLAGEPVPSEGTGSLGMMHAVAHGGDLRLAVGAAGRIAQWTGGGFTLQPSPTSRALHAAWLSPDGQDGWIGGDDGVLLRRTALGWQMWSEAADAQVIAIHGRAVHDVWLVDAGAQLQHWNGKEWTPVAGPWPKSEAMPGSAPNASPPRRIHALWHAPDGTLLLAGDDGALVLGEWMPLGFLKFTKLATGTLQSLRALAPAPDGDVWVCGDRGALGRWNGAFVKWIPTGTQRPLYALFGGQGVASPLHAVGAQGTWLRMTPTGAVEDFSVPELRVDLRGVLPTFNGGYVAVGEPVVVLGPYLEMPYIAVPGPAAALGLTVRWAHAGGVTPSLNILRITDMAYNTRWEVFLRGPVDEVRLPDWKFFGAATPLPAGNVMLRIWRVLADGLDVDHFNAKLLNSWAWTSWAYNNGTVSSFVQPDGNVRAKPPSAAPGRAPGLPPGDNPPK
ncbi:MAG: hypothetical protein EXR79_13910 [Myxococcales bacterium]|nr:hypothetical protein [Myxococcales bacterium]